MVAPGKIGRADKHEVTVAVVASWLPPFEPPVGENGFDRPYADRLKVVLSVDDGETLDEIYRRAITQIRPRAVKEAQGYTDDPIDVVRWAWFYEASDQEGIDSSVKTWEVAEDLITVGEDGRARWSRAAHEINFGDLVRAGHEGLLRGDPHPAVSDASAATGRGVLQHGLGWSSPPLATRGPSPSGAPDDRPRQGSSPDRVSATI